MQSFTINCPCYTMQSLIFKFPCYTMQIFIINCPCYTMQSPIAIIAFHGRNHGAILVPCQVTAPSGLLK